MPEATVTKLRTKTSPISTVAPIPRSAAWKRKIARQGFASYAVGTVALVLTGLSLSHLAAGVQTLTHGSEWHAWAMALGIDLGFIGLELAQLCVTTADLRRTVERFACPAVQGTLVMSALMNAYAFAIHAPNAWFAGAACVLGVSIPALIYVLTRVSVAMWIDCQK